MRIGWRGYADRFRNKRRRDSGAMKDLRNELQDSLDEIAIHVDAVLDEWLAVADNGKPHLLIRCSQYLANGLVI